MITILFLAADSTNMLRLDEEARAIDQSLRMAKLREHFKFAQHWAVKTSDLQELLLRYKPEIVHFSGHGNLNSEIVLYDDYGKSSVVSVNALKSLFSTLSENLQCVILNSCYSKAQAKAIAEKIHYVIGMSDKITDEAAKTFSTAFYRAIGYEKDIKTAFELGVNQISLENLGEQEIPQLISLKTDKSKIVLASKNAKTVKSQSNAESEIRVNMDDLNEVISKYVEQNPLLTDVQVIDKLSNIVKAKINYKSSLPDESGTFEVSKIAGGIYVRFTVEAQIHEKYNFEATPLDGTETKIGRVNKMYSDKRIFFTFLAADSGLSEYEKPTGSLDLIWSSKTQNEPFQNLPFLINPLLAAEIKRSFYEAIQGIATRGVDNNVPMEFLKSMSLYEYEFPQEFHYWVSNPYLAGIFPSQYKVTVEAMPIYKVIYKKLAPRERGWIFKEPNVQLLSGH